MIKDDDLFKFIDNKKIIKKTNCQVLNRSCFGLK